MKRLTRLERREVQPSRVTARRGLARGRLRFVSSLETLDCLEVTIDSSSSRWEHQGVVS
jgi:hypothetical protein